MSGVSGDSSNALSSGAIKSIVWLSPGDRYVERHTPLPRCHSTINTIPDTAVTWQPSAHNPIYGYNGSPSGV